MNHSFKVRRGVLGQCKLTRFCAAGLRDATLLILRRFCTPRWATPLKRKGAPKAALRDDLMADIIPKIEVFAADGAADEQKAGRMLMHVDTRQAVR